MNFTPIKFKKKHDRNCFYKYCSLETAKKIIINETLRYSSPAIFNDPFDFQYGLNIDLNTDNFTAIFINRVEELVKAAKEPVFNFENGFTKTIKFMREKYPTHGFPKENIHEFTKPFLKDLIDGLNILRSNYLDFLNDFMLKLRIFCLSESYDNILMWSHYSAYHKGVVIRFDVAKDEKDDDPLWIAEKVNYVPTSHAFITEKQLLDELTGVSNFNLPDLSKKLVCNKYDIWDYESEWRVWTTVDSTDPDKLYDDIKFKINKIGAIYFGCKCQMSDEKDLIDILNNKNIKFEIFKAKKHDYLYKLNFEQIA